LGAGGRYNNLVSELGGAKVDAVGFALGVERILLARAKGQDYKQSTDLFIIALEESSFLKAFELTHFLRGKCLENNIENTIEMSYSRTSLKSQMRSANKKGARFVVILGEEELKKGVVTLKDMGDGGQTQQANYQEALLKLLININVKGKQARC
ncbi:His/Gly/Thr/Pro-type tRNA ligase C-terminal domain-containing protein, partial [Deltaproteobacteria bacterium TL4]